MGYLSCTHLHPILNFKNEVTIRQEHKVVLPSDRTMVPLKHKRAKALMWVLGNSESLIWRRAKFIAFSLEGGPKLREETSRPQSVLI